MIASNEIRHIHEGPRTNERPAGIGVVRLIVDCQGDPDRVVAKAKEVLLVVLSVSGERWPSVADWQLLLPEWFVVSSGRETTANEDEAWLEWWRRLPPTKQTEAAADREWAIDGWIHWMQPDERNWFWWHAQILSSTKVLLEVQVDAWPVPLGSLKWLLVNPTSATGRGFQFFLGVE